MDRDDVRFAADVLASRICGDREALDRLQATSLFRLTASAAVLKRAAADWPPAHLAALELETIAKHGGDTADAPPQPELQEVEDSLRSLLAEPVGRNRHERRRRAKLNLSRRERLGVIRAGVAK